MVSLSGLTDILLFRRLGPDEQRRVSMAITPRVASIRPAFDTEIDLVIEGS